MLSCCFLHHLKNLDFRQISAHASGLVTGNPATPSLDRGSPDCSAVNLTATFPRPERLRGKVLALPSVCPFLSRAAHSGNPAHTLRLRRNLFLHVDQTLRQNRKKHLGHRIWRHALPAAGRSRRLGRIGPLRSREGHQLFRYRSLLLRRPE